ncbi:hypothetical protein GWK47_026327 [Chionoecetes opilio]|uniref:Uncharacterized protein n=1 Tax=Chionoecetes opilio TaxID=41210 RepID=A0A8J8WMW8_CHIOP|nr:hypothetical protein GWK47_026327 [Chionoecetes opilio]
MSTLIWPGKKGWPPPRAKGANYGLPFKYFGGELPVGERRGALSGGWARLPNHAQMGRGLPLFKLPKHYSVGMAHTLNPIAPPTSRLWPSGTRGPLAPFTKGCRKGPGGLGETRRTGLWIRLPDGPCPPPPLHQLVRHLTRPRGRHQGPYVREVKDVGTKEEGSLRKEGEVDKFPPALQYPPSLRFRRQEEVEETSSSPGGLEKKWWETPQSPQTRSPPPQECLAGPF